MLTWKLWRRLRQHPLEDPVFHYARQRYKRQQPRRFRFFLLFMLYVFGCLTCTFIWPLLIRDSMTVIVALVSFGHMAFGAVLAASGGAALAYEREQDTYDLLCVSPSGTMGISWSLSAGRVHASTLFDITHFLIILLLLGIGTTAVVAVVLPFSLMQDNRANLALPLLGLFAAGFVIVLGLYLDHVQSIVLATLCGMWAGTATTNRLNARLYAGAVFLLLKLSVYFVLLYLALNLLPGLFVLAFLGLILLVVLLYLLHEITVRMLWALLNRTLHNTEQFF